MRWAAAIVLFAVLLAPLRAMGQKPQTDPEAAEALFLAGRDLMDKKDYAAACPKFAESDRLDPSSGARINLADCEEKIGRVAAAWRHWQEAIELIPANDPRRPGVEKRRVDVEKRVPRLTLKSSTPLPSGAVVLRDDVEVGLGALEVALPVDPGAHTIVVKAPGHKDWKEDLTIKEAERRDVQLQIGQAEEAPPPLVTKPVPAPKEAPPSKIGKYIGFGLVGLGSVSVVVGSIAGGIAIAKKNALPTQCYPMLTCTPEGADTASAGRTLATVSTVGIVAGAIAVVGGVVLVLAWPSGKKTVAIGPGTLEGTF